MTNLLDFDYEHLLSLMETFGEKSYRAKQLMHWIYKENLINFNEMTDISKVFRDVLKDKTNIQLPSVMSDAISDDGTRKWLFDVGGSNGIETVFIPEDDRGTLCVSSQVGCALECTFCSTGRQGFNRNLTTAEIIGQVWLANFRNVNVNYNIPIDISNIKLYGNTNYYISPFITISGPINPRILTSNIPSKTYNKTTNITISFSDVDPFRK